MSGKRRLMLSSRQRLGVAVAVVVVLYVVVAAWAALSRQPDPVSVAPAPPIFPEGVGSPSPPVPVLPPTTGFEDGDRASPTPSGGRSGGEPTEGAGPGPGGDGRDSGNDGSGADGSGDDGSGSDDGSGDDGGNAGGDRDDQGEDTPTKPPPPQAGPFTSRYTVTENGSRTFHARVFLTNRGQTTRNWSVRITFAASDRVDVGRTLGALKRTSGNTYVFSGFRARPGQTEIFGFDATKGVTGTVRPTTCDVEGRDCDIRIG